MVPSWISYGRYQHSLYPLNQYIQLVELVSVSTLPNPVDVFSAWISPFTYLVDIFVNLWQSSVWELKCLNVEPCLPYLSLYPLQKTFLFVDLLCVISWCSRNGTSKSSFKSSCLFQHLLIRRSACSAPDSQPESLECTGEANVIFRNGISVVGIPNSSMDAARRWSESAFLD